MLSTSFAKEGFWGIAALKPYSLFGLEGWNHIAHGAFWSLLTNGIAFVTVSLYSQGSPLEIIQADLFVDIYKHQQGEANYEVIRRRAKVFDVKNLLLRFLGPEKALAILAAYEEKHQIDLAKTVEANEELIKLVETQLAGLIGAASTKKNQQSIEKDEPISLLEMLGKLEKCPKNTEQIHWIQD